jgi:hypothetical protein
VLRVPLNIFREKGSAPQLSDCECIGLRVCEKANYEVIAEQLSEVFERSGNPIAIIKNQTSNLAKGVKQYYQSVSEKK